MSNSIDERVVQLEFQNSNFEKNISQSISSLEALEKSLSFSGMKDGLGDIANSIRNIDTSQAASSVDGLSSRFSGLQAIATGALLAIGAKVTELATNMASSLGQSLFSSITEGYSDYNTKLTSVQTIMNATGSSIDEVSGYFDQLDTYADKTIYNLQDMTSSFAKFTNAGVSMDKSIPAIKGIANMVAVAGGSASEASIAMYNLSQSIAGGFLTTTDYRSLTLANVATAEWKQQMVDAAVAAGTLTKAADGTYGIVSEGSKKAYTAQSLFNDALSTGWATTDVMLGVFNDYADATTDIGKKAYAAAQNVKSLPMMFETLSAQAATGWTDTFQILLGNVTESTELFTYLTNTIGEFINETTNARNAQLQIWHDTTDVNGMTARQALIEAMKNSFTALGKIITPIKEAFAEVFPPKLGSTMASISFALRDFTQGLIISDDAAAGLKKVATALFSVIKVGTDIIGNIFSVIGNTIAVVWNLAGAFTSLISPIVKFAVALIPVSDNTANTTDILGWFFDMLNTVVNFISGPVISWLGKAGDAFDNFLNGNEMTSKIEGIKSALNDFGLAIQSVYNILLKGDFTANPLFSEDSKLTDFLFNVRDAFLNIGETAKNSGNNLTAFGSAVASVWNILAHGDFTSNPLFSEDSAFTDFLFKVRDAIGNIGKNFKDAASSIKPFFEGLSDNLSTAFKDVDWDTVIAAINSGVLAALAIALVKGLNKISGIFQGVTDIFKPLGDALDSLTGVLDNMQKKVKAQTLLMIAAAIGVLAVSIAILSRIEPARIVSASAGIAAGFAILIGGFTAIEKLKIGENSPSVKFMASMILMAIAIDVLASAIAKIAGYSWNDLAKGLTGVVVSMGVLVGAAKLLASAEKDMIKGATAMNLMAIAITTMAGAIAIFGLLPTDVLIQGGIAVVAMLGVLTGAAILLSKVAPNMVLSAVGLMAMAAAINLLVIPIVTLGLIPMAVLAQGLTTIAIALGLLIAAAALLSAFAPSMVLSAVGLLAMAAALNLMVAPIIALGLIPFDVLVQGLVGIAAALAILVVAANAMTTAIVGAGAMIVVAGAMLILASAIMIVGQMSIGQVAVGILGLAAAIIVIGGTAAIIGLFSPLILAFAASLVVLGAGMALAAVSLVAFSIGLAALGPALAIAAAGLMTFSVVAPNAVSLMGSMLALGAGLLVFGAGALVAGAGILVLGTGLNVLSTALLMIAISGIAGAFALEQVSGKIAGLVGQAIPLGIMAATFATLGAATAVLGAGLLVLGAGALITAVGLALLVPLGALINASFALLVKAIEHLIPQVDAINSLSSAFTNLSGATQKIGAYGMSASAGILATAVGFTALSAAAMVASVAVVAMMVAISTTIPRATRQMQTMTTAYSRMVVSINQNGSALKKGISETVANVTESIRRLGITISKNTVSSISASGPSVYAAAIAIGNYIDAGLIKGIYNGSSKVNAAAAYVARQALAASKKELGVASPSKEYEEVGMYSDEGLAKGMLDNVSVVEKSSATVAGSALDKMSESLSNYDYTPDLDLYPVITPVLDLSGVKSSADSMNAMFQSQSLSLDMVYANAVQAAATYDASNAKADSALSTVTNNYTFNQTNNSPKALSQTEIYRQTNNLISRKQKELAG